MVCDTHLFFCLQRKKPIWTQVIRALREALVSYLIFAPCLQVYLLIQRISRMILVPDVLVLCEHSLTFWVWSLESRRFALFDTVVCSWALSLRNLCVKGLSLMRSWWLSGSRVGGISSFWWEVLTGNVLLGPERRWVMLKGHLTTFFFSFFLTGIFHTQLFLGVWPKTNPGDRGDSRFR